MLGSTGSAFPSKTAQTHDTLFPEAAFGSLFSTASLLGSLLKEGATLTVFPNLAQDVRLTTAQELPVVAVKSLGRAVEHCSWQDASL